MDLSAELPPDIVEKVLLLLPVSDLCRCRIVCKLWNRLICRPDFGALYAQHAPRIDTSFIVMHHSRIRKRRGKSVQTHGWCSTARDVTSPKRLKWLRPLSMIFLAYCMCALCTVRVLQWAAFYFQAAKFRNEVWASDAHWVALVPLLAVVINDLLAFKFFT